MPALRSRRLGALLIDTVPAFGPPFAVAWGSASGTAPPPASRRELETRERSLGAAETEARSLHSPP